MEKSFKIEIHTLLPEIETSEDCCIDHLEKMLEGQEQIRGLHLEKNRGDTELRLDYDPEVTNPSELRRLVEHAGHVIANRYHHESISIQGMDCSDCTLVLEHGLTRLEGVHTARVNYPAQKLWIDYDSSRVNRWMIEKRIHSLGYSIPLIGRRKWLQERRELITSLVFGLLVLAGWSGYRFFGLPGAISPGSLFDRLPGRGVEDRPGGLVRA